MPSEDWARISGIPAQSAKPRRSARPSTAVRRTGEAEYLPRSIAGGCLAALRTWRLHGVGEGARDGVGADQGPVVGQDELELAVLDAERGLGEDLRDTGAEREAEAKREAQHVGAARGALRHHIPD